MNNTSLLNPVKLLSPAKINVTLDILGKDERGGKHFVNTILYRDDSLFDELVLTPQSGENTVHCENPEVPLDESNSMLQALKLLQVKGWNITMKKNIPIQAGLGGGSSNAATVLKYFGTKFHLRTHELEKLGRQIGADVPFFLQDENLVYCEGFGDQVVLGWNIQPLQIEYVPTGIKVSTTKAYAEVDLDLCAEQSVQTELLLKKLQSSPELPNEIWKHFVHNDFELSFFEKHPEWNAKGTLCGSGGLLWRFK